jgi:CheY-like chemotaxis protein
MKRLIIAEGILSAFERPDSLFKRGFIDVHPARTSEEILHLHRERRADLIIADEDLPLMGGEKLCSAVRRDADLRDVSLIIVCGTEAVAARCREAGANAVMMKPADPAVFFGMVAELIVVPVRKDMRVLLRINVLGGDRSVPFFASSENISISGMLIDAAVRLNKDDRVLCRFYIGHTEMKAEARVIRTDVSPACRFRYGVKFENLDAKMLIIIDQFIRSRIRTGRKPA